MGKKLLQQMKNMKKEQLFVWILLGALVVVILLPVQKDEKREMEKDSSSVGISAPAVDESVSDDQVSCMEKELEEILSSVQGVGKVRVMLTLESTNTKIVEKDIPDSSSSQKQQDQDGSMQESVSSSAEEKTVYEKSRDGDQIPYVISEEYPDVRGVLVIAQGGSSPEVVREIQEAVQALFHVEPHKIKVMKMKS